MKKDRALEFCQNFEKYIDSIIENSPEDLMIGVVVYARDGQCTDYDNPDGSVKCSHFLRLTAFDRSSLKQIVIEQINKIESNL